MKKRTGKNNAQVLCLCFIAASLLFSCTGTEKRKMDSGELKSTYPLPDTVLLDTMPPPKSVDLKNVPKPQMIQVPKTAGGFYYKSTSDNNKEKIELKPPNIVKAQLPLVNFTNFNSDNKLPSNSINCGLMDKKGQLWFSTANGAIFCYDGVNFTKYLIGQGGGVVTQIIEDRAGNLWVGTRGNGVFRYNGISFANFTLEDGLPNNYIKCILEDKNGNLWFGTEGGGISRYDGSHFKSFTTKDGLAANTVYSIAEDKSGNLWFGTIGGGASRYDGTHFTTFTTEQGLADNYVLNIMMDRNGNLWFGTYKNGASRYDGKRFTNFNSKNGLASDNVNHIAEDKNGNLWFGCIGGGVSRYDGNNFTTFTKEQGLANNDIMWITEDKNRSLWFCTQGGGISRYNGSGITTFTNKQGLPQDLIWAVKEDKKGNLWFGTENNGVICYNGTHYTSYSPEQGLIQKLVYSIEEDKSGRLWFGTIEGVSCFDGKSFTNYTTKQGLGFDVVTCIKQDKRGGLWFGTEDGGVSRFNGIIFTTFTSVQGLAHNTINCITEGPDGDIWFATAGGGVSRYNGLQFITYTSAQGLANNKVRSILVDKSDHLWFGTAGGVSRFDGSGFISFTTKQGLSDDQVYAMAEDEQGVIWFGNSNGLNGLKFKTSIQGNKPAEIKGAGLLNITNEQLKSYSFVWEIYNNNTGYPIKNFNDGVLCVTKLGLPLGDKNDTGIIWGGCGDQKLIRFDRKPPYKNLEPIPVFIQAIKIDEENINWYSLSQKKKDSAVIAQQDMMVYGSALSIQERDSLQRKFRDIKFDSILPYYQLPVNLVLPYRHNQVSFDFGAIETGRSFMVRYQYMLEGYDKEWSPVTEKTSASFGNISEGTYTFKLKAKSPEGIWSDAISYSFNVLPPWWRTWWMYVIYFLWTAFCIYGFIRWRTNSLHQEKLHLEEIVSERTRQVEHKSAELEHSLKNLKATQSQLIHSEKMASLGELTAGIAHEIQNPLNFVNNFSEVNKELLLEMKDEIEKGNLEEVKAIATGVIENQEKINHHGQRAGAIVKSMLQHSRGSESGNKKELTDINALADEYFRLAYYGLKAKDKTFNPKMVPIAIGTDFDTPLGKINIVPQEIGRVLLNLFNNAFYAVNEKMKLNSEKFDPMVTVSTKKIGDRAEIRVKDNGNGIPDKILEKIFQPFFTTKPAGQGTGLGLSLSYDIVKAHGGELKVETKEGEGSEFIIQLPVV